MNYSFCIPLSFNNLLHDNDSINDSLCLPDNNDNLLCGELFMLHLEDYRDYYALENKENTLKYDIIWLKKFFSLEVIKNKKMSVRYKRKKRKIMFKMSRVHCLLLRLLKPCQKLCSK